MIWFLILRIRALLTPEAPGDSPAVVVARAKKRK